MTSTATTVPDRQSERLYHDLLTPPPVVAIREPARRVAADVVAPAAAAIAIGDERVHGFPHAVFARLADEGYSPSRSGRRSPSRARAPGDRHRRHDRRARLLLRQRRGGLRRAVHPRRQRVDPPNRRPAAAVAAPAGGGRDRRGARDNRAGGLQRPQPEPSGPSPSGATAVGCSTATSAGSPTRRWRASSSRSPGPATGYPCSSSIRRCGVCTSDGRT